MDLSPWKAGDPITPKESLVDLFYGWDETKSKSKLRSFQRAKEWISKLMKIPFPGLSSANKMRKEDLNKAISHMVDSLTLGSNLDDYIKSCLQFPKGNVPEIANDVLKNDDESINTEPCTSSSLNQPKSMPDKKLSTNMTVKKKPPVCQFTWLGKECNNSECKKSHPTLCNNPRCMDMDQDLPRWKSTGCGLWHGRSKNKSKNTEKKDSGKKVINNKIGKAPISKPKMKNPQKNPQNHLRKAQNSSSHHSGSKSKGPYARPQTCQKQCNQHQSGNGVATWPPLTRNGSNQRGIPRMSYSMAVRGPTPTIQTTPQIAMIQENVQSMIQEGMNHLMSQIQAQIQDLNNRM